MTEWNPWQGCTKVSPGCYAEALATRWGKDFTTLRRSAPTTFEAPLRWKEPKLIFTCSISDFFHRQADPWREEAWEVIKATPHHTYQILTKRPGLMVAWAKTHGWPDNVWAGTSVESQKYAPRLDVLARVPAKVRFVSVEPMLGPVDLMQWIELGLGWYGENVNGGLEPDRACNWVICGGESGPGARPMHPDWARSLRDQCQAAGVPFFFKQWGEWAPFYDVMLHDKYGTGAPLAEYNFPIAFRKVGKKTAGALLDGREWREMPPMTSP